MGCKKADTKNTKLEKSANVLEEQRSVMAKTPEVKARKSADLNTYQI